MAENSKISWTDHTFNPWWGCVEVSPACDNCYARGFDKRVGGDHWNGTRRFFGDKHWNEPLKWNRDAIKDFGRPARVFCASMADVFEVRGDLGPHRERLWKLIEATPNLRWNLLTKRHLQIAFYKLKWGKLPNAHIGVTVENQTYDFRITPNVEWLSCEPLFGHMNLRPFLQQGNIHWVIIGGESGSHAREMPIEAAQDLIEQCKRYRVAVHFKQTGDVLARKLGLKDKSGKNPSEWPAELRIQEFPEVPCAKN